MRGTHIIERNRPAAFDIFLPVDNHEIFAEFPPLLPVTMLKSHYLYGKCLSGLPFG